MIKKVKKSNEMWVGSGPEQADTVEKGGYINQ